MAKSQNAKRSFKPRINNRSYGKESPAPGSVNQWRRTPKDIPDDVHEILDQLCDIIGIPNWEDAPAFARDIKNDDDAKQKFAAGYCKLMEVGKLIAEYAESHRACVIFLEKQGPIRGIQVAPPRRRKCWCDKDASAAALYDAFGLVALQPRTYLQIFQALGSERKAKMLEAIFAKHGHTTEYRPFIKKDNGDSVEIVPQDE